MKLLFQEYKDQWQEQQAKMQQIQIASSFGSSLLTSGQKTT
jgi:hypothetical protein